MILLYFKIDSDGDKTNDDKDQHYASQPHLPPEQHELSLGVVHHGLHPLNLVRQLDPEMLHLIFVAGVTIVTTFAVICGLLSSCPIRHFNVSVLLSTLIK